MKRLVYSILSILLMVSLVGCKTKMASEKTPFEIMQEKASAITAAGGIAAVGIGNSRNTALALDKAKNRARQELASIIQSKVDSLRKDFQEEIGEGKSAEFNALFSAASKTLVSQELRGSVPKDIKYDIKDGLTSAYALMILDPKVLADAFAAQANTQRHLYTRFRASQAFSELDKDLEKYEEWKQQDGMGVVQ